MQPRPVEWFLAKVKRGKPNECWPYTGTIDKDGYGIIWINHKRRPAHVIAYEYENGPMPADKPFGLHRCDNRPCCNPSHIFPGTRGDNARDARAKGRRFGGRKRGQRIFTWDEVQAIQAEVRSGKSQAQVAREHNITPSAVTSMMKRKGPHPIVRGSDVGTSRFTQTDILEIRRLYATGKYTQHAIGKKFNARQSVIEGIVNRRTWKHI